MHWRPPEVIEEEIRHRLCGTKIPVVFDCADIIEDETAIQRIVVTDQRSTDHKQQVGCVCPHGV